MSLSFGSCLCCGKTAGFEKINLCDNCEKKYIEDIKKYVRENGKIGSNGRKTVDVEEIKEKLNLSSKVITYFAEEGILDLIFNDEEIPDKKSSKEDGRAALIKSLNVYGPKGEATLQKKNENPFNNGHVNAGMHSRGRK